MNIFVTNSENSGAAFDAAKKRRTIMPFFLGFSCVGRSCPLFDWLRGQASERWVNMGVDCFGVKDQTMNAGNAAEKCDEVCQNCDCRDVRETYSGDGDWFLELAGARTRYKSGR